MKKLPLLLSSLFLLATTGATIGVDFDKRVLVNRYFCDGINFGDFNRDGNRDIVAGPFWYEGPSFENRHAFYPPIALPPAASPSNSMFSYVWDFDGDGWDDILVLGRVHKHQAAWYRNPAGKKKPWKKHFAFERIKGESPPFLDIDNDGFDNAAEAEAGSNPFHFLDTPLQQVGDINQDGEINEEEFFYIMSQAGNE